MHEAVHGTLFLNDLAYQSLDAINLAQIANITGMATSFKVLASDFKLLLVSVKQDDLSAMRGQQCGNGLSHASRGTSDKYLFTCKI